MRNYFLMIPALLLFITTQSMAAVAPAKVIGATTVDTMFAKGLWDKGDIIFIDVRPQEKYKAGHIPRAKNLPLDNFTPETLSAIAKKNDRVVFYCTGVPCLASSEATKKALEWGWTSVFYYRKGFSSWKGAGLAVEK